MPPRQLRRLAWRAVGIVYALAARGIAASRPNVLLLAGVTLNAFFSALILFVQYFADFRRRIARCAG